MTISSSIRRAGPYIGTGALVAYPFAFKVFQASDVYVVPSDTSGVQLAWTLGVEYTVTLNDDQDTAPGGVVTPTGALPAGYSLLISSAVPATQPMSLSNQGGFYPKSIEYAFDRLTILVQQQGATATPQTLRVPEVTGINLLPVAASRANTMLAFDSLGNPLCAAPASGSAADLAINLANASDVAKGTALIGHLPSGAGAVGRTLRTRMAEFVMATDYSSLQAAYNALPATGGVVMVPAGYSTTLGADLVMNKPFSGFLFFGAATITMGAYKLVMQDSCPGQFIDTLNGVSGGDYSAQVTSGVFWRFSGGVGSVAMQIGQGTLQISSAQDCFRRLRGFALNIEGAGVNTIGIQLNNQVRMTVEGVNVKASGAGADGKIGLQLKAVGSGYVGWVNIRDSFFSGGMVGVDTVGQVNLCTWVGGGCSTSPVAGTSWGIRRGAGGSAAFFSRDIEIAGATRAVELSSGVIGDRHENYGESNTYDVYFDSGALNNVYINTAASTGPLVSDGNGANTTNVAVGAGSVGVAGDLYLAGNSNAIYGRTSGGNHRKLLSFSASATTYYGDIAADVLAHQFLGASGTLAFLNAAGMKVTGGLGVNGANPAAQSTGWGSPTGASPVSNFPGATATLGQCSQALAQIIATLKSAGVLGN